MITPTNGQPDRKAGSGKAEQRSLIESGLESPDLLSAETAPLDVQDHPETAAESEPKSGGELGKKPLLQHSPETVSHSLDAGATTKLAGPDIIKDPAKSKSALMRALLNKLNTDDGPNLIRPSKLIDDLRAIKHAEPPETEIL